VRYALAKHIVAPTTEEIKSCAPTRDYGHFLKKRNESSFAGVGDCLIFSDARRCSRLARAARFGLVGMNRNAGRGAAVELGKVLAAVQAWGGNSHTRSGGDEIRRNSYLDAEANRP